MSLLRAGLALALGISGGFGEVRVLHDSSVSSSRVEVLGTEVRVRLSLGLEDFLTLADPRDRSPDDSSWITPEGFRRLLPGVFESLKSHYLLSSFGEPGRAELAGGEFPGTQPIPLSSARSAFAVDVRFRFSFPVRRLQIHCDVLQDRVKDHRHLAELSDGQVFAFDSLRTDGEWSARPSWRERLIEGGLLGMRYALWAGPGFLLFSLALGSTALTIRGRLVRSAALWIGSAIAFWAATRGWLRLPEPLIAGAVAGSVVYLALESALAPRAPGRWMFGGGLGLFHGAAMSRFLGPSEPSAALLWGGCFMLGVAGGQALHLGALTLAPLGLRRVRGGLRERRSKIRPASLGTRREAEEPGILGNEDPRAVGYLGLSPVTFQSGPPQAAQTSLKLLDEITPPAPLLSERTPT